MLVQNPPIVLLGEYLMKMDPEERAHAEQMIRSGIHFLDSEPDHYTIEIPWEGDVVPESQGLRMRPHLSIEARVLRKK